MKNAFLTITLALFVALNASAQTSAPTQTVKKAVGDTVNFTWDYNVADEPTITHFSFRMVDDLTKTSIEVKQVAKNLRSTSLAASYTTNLTFMYYNIYAVKTINGGSDEVSTPSNTVATQRTGKPPKTLIIIP